METEHSTNFTNRTKWIIGSTICWSLFLLMLFEIFAFALRSSGDFFRAILIYFVIPVAALFIIFTLGTSYSFEFKSERRSLSFRGFPLSLFLLAFMLYFITSDVIDFSKEFDFQPLILPIAIFFLLPLPAMLIDRYKMENLQQKLFHYLKYFIVYFFLFFYCGILGLSTVWVSNY